MSIELHPSSVVGTSSELFLEFETARDGPLLGTGFDLRVGHLPGKADQYYSEGNDGSGERVCHRVFDSDSTGGREGLFLSLEHWDAIQKIFRIWGAYQDLL